MKKIIVISFIAAFSFGFTLTSDTSTKLASDCPYLNEIHSGQQTYSGDCPYLEKKLLKENKSEMKSDECPYSGNTKKSETECPYLQEKNEKTNEDIYPMKRIQLKTS